MSVGELRCVSGISGLPIDISLSSVSSSHGQSMSCWSSSVGLIQSIDSITPDSKIRRIVNSK